MATATTPLSGLQTFLLVGQSGTGKTTFISSALNYLYGVEKAYDFR